MAVEVVSQTIRRGPQHWRINPDSSWSVLMFGSFGPGQAGLCHRWMPVPIERVPDEVRRAVK